MSIVVQHRRDTTANVEGNTPAAGELWIDTTKNEISLGNGALAGGIRQQKKNTSEVLIAAQLVANTNDYSPAGLKHASALLISTDASRDITGLVAVGVVDTVDGREITIYNAGAFNAVLKDQNVASAAANRFDLGGADITLQPKSSMTLRYRTQGALNRWEIKASTAGATIADGGVIARKLAASALGARIGMINGTLVESHAGSAATFAVKTQAGADPSVADPVYFIFNTGAGAYVVRTVSAALSLTISSGSAMGVAAINTAFRVWVLAVDNAGSVELAAVNCSDTTGFLALNEDCPITTLAEGGAGAADAIRTIYSATARAAKYFCIVGFANYDTGLAAVGAWAASPTTINLFGAGVPRPGDVLGDAYVATGVGASGTTLVPADNSIPQNTEGDQFMTLAYTPRGPANILDVSAQVYGSQTVAGNLIAIAVFRDSIASAKAVGYTDCARAGGALELSLDGYRDLAGAVTATTYKTRVGLIAAGTFGFNNGSALFGGAFNSSMRIRELMG